MSNDATLLIQKLNGSPTRKIRKSTKSLVLSLLSYLEELQRKERCKDHNNNPDYVIGCIFRSSVFNNQNEYRAYSKSQLVLAVNWLKELIKTIEENHKAGLTFYTASKYREHLTSWILEIKPYVEFLERRVNPQYEFIWGVNPNYRQSWQIFKEARMIYWSSSHSGGARDHVIAVNLSAFSLRQSLEIKFQRMLGVMGVYSPSFESPKFRHDFFPDFIEDNMLHFEIPFASLTNIIKIYKWTNYHIHTGIAPRTWELDYAFSYCNKLFAPSKPARNKAWSIYDAVKIKDYNSLLRKLHQKVYEEFQNKDGKNQIYCFDIRMPEAVII